MSMCGITTTDSSQIPGPSTEPGEDIEDGSEVQVDIGEDLPWIHGASMRRTRHLSACSEFPRGGF